MAISRTARNGVVVIVVCFPYPKLHANSVAWLAEPAVGGCGVRVGRCCGYCGRSVYVVRQGANSAKVIVK